METLEDTLCAIDIQLCTIMRGMVFHDLPKSFSLIYAAFLSMFSYAEGRQSMMEDLRLFALITGLAELFGLLSVILMCTWLSSYYGGFSLQTSDTKFNLHPLLMTFAFVFLFGNAIIIYRVFRRIQKIKIKLAHAGLQLFILILVVIATKIAWDGHEEGNEQKSHSESTDHGREKRHAGMHDEGPVVHLATLHTWLGLITLILFSTQWLFGLLAFLWPQARLAVRQFYMPIHVFWGAAIFILAAVSALTGIVMFSTRMAVKHKLQSLPSEGWLINMLGLCISLYVITVVYILVQPGYKRRALPEEEDKIPLTSQD